MKTRLLIALLALLLATSAQAQQRQPANVSTLPATSPQEFDLLDNQGRWMPFGTASGGAFTASGGGGTDVRQFGCVDDGVTDQAACINIAIANAPGCVIIPPTVSGFYVAPTSTINATKCLKGSFYNPDYSTPYPGVFAGQPWIKCGTSATSVCVKATYDGAYSRENSDHRRPHSRCPLSVPLACKLRAATLRNCATLNISGSRHLRLLAVLDRCWQRHLQPRHRAQSFVVPNLLRRR